MKSQWIKVTIRVIAALAIIKTANVMAIDQQTADKAQIDNNWFKPILTESYSPLCSQFLDNAKAAFFSGDFYSGYKSVADKVLIAGAYSETQVDHVLIDNTPVYVKVVLEHGCGGACEGAQIVSSLTPIDSNKRYANAFDENQLKAMPIRTQVNDTWFIEASDHRYYSVSANDSISIYQLQTDASWIKSCEINIVPTEKDYQESASASEARKAIAKLNTALQPLMGTYGNCGSSRAGSRQLRLLDKLLNLVVYRPWVLNQKKDASSATKQYLEEWSTLGISQNISYKLFQAELTKTKSEIKKFYMGQYGWNGQQAEQAANFVINHVIQRAIQPAVASQANDRKQILNALLEKGDISIIKTTETNLASLNVIDGGGSFNDTLVAAAIGYPSALQYLLQQKLSPNDPNTFGKTPLMYAAQYNQLESARLLLDAGADVNAETIIPADDCNFTLSKYGMTALHYAVRYSSKDLIELLLEKGANPYAKTSEKHGGRPIDWLQKYALNTKEETNPNLSKTDALALMTHLQMPSPDEIQRQVKNLNLEAEKQYQNGKKEGAYKTIKKALNLDPLNDRSLANASLIAIRTGRILEGLQASQTVISNSNDINQKANALFNYALACETNSIDYDRYNGEIYCAKHPVFYLLDSHDLKASKAKAEKIIQAFTEREIQVCAFPDGIYITNKMSAYGSERALYVLRHKDSSFNAKDVLFVSNDKTHQLENQLNTYDFDNYLLEVYKSAENIYTPIRYKDHECKGNARGEYFVE